MATVPMIAPDGSSGDIPKERAQEAYAAGFKRAVVMHSPDGQTGYVPMERAQEALNAGFKVGQNISEVDNPKEKLGLWDTVKGVGEKAADFAKGVVTSPSQVLGNPMKAAAQTVFSAANAYNHTPQDQYRTPVEPVAMATGAALGADTPKMADAFKRRDPGAALVEATPLLAQAAAPAVTKGATRVLGDVAGKLPDSIRPEGAQASFVKEYMDLHPKAVRGLEELFKAEAPTGKGGKSARPNLAVAAGDLNEIGQSIKNVQGDAVPLSDAKGGIINPDMRAQAVVSATRDHLAKMYAEERAPQIARNASDPVNVGVNPNAARGLDFLASTAGDVADSALAKKALDGQPLTVAEADKLAIVANQTLKSFEKMTPEGKMQAQMTNPKIAGLKALDQELSNNLNDALTSKGEVGLKSYERRYAAVSQFLDNIETRKQAAELNQPGVVKKAGNLVGSVLRGNKAEFASASQAAVADVNLGKSLQRGFNLLKESGVKVKR